MNRKFIYSLLYALLLFLVQTAFLKVFSQNLYLVPQFALIFVVIFALDNSLKQIIWLSFWSGFFEELFSGLSFGSHIFALVLIGILIYLLTRKFTAREMFFPILAVLVFTATFVYALSNYGFNSLSAFLNLAKSVPLKDFFDLRLIWTVPINFLLFYPLRFIFRLWQRSDA